MENSNNIRCTYCKQLIDTKVEIVLYNEDYEPCHSKCLEDFIVYWDERDEFMDLLGH